MSLILGIESSCDETAAAVVEDGFRVLSSEVASQIAKHAVHGGVVPELAAREHLKALTPVVSGALKQANVTLKDISAIAVTQGPGLIPALLVGLNYAKGLSQINQLPLVGVNHFLAHIYGAFLDSSPDVFADESLYPILALVVSGGHTSLMLIDREGKAQQLGCTIDDAAGEALDKGAKLLGLGYPGGPVIQKVAQGGDPERFHFPRPLTGGAGKPVSPENRYNFSFSGIKTALLYHTQKYPELSGELLADTVASYQAAVVDVLVRKAADARRTYGARTVVVAGGVACNAELRARMAQSVGSSAKLMLAPPKYCTDNAAMVAGAGFHGFRRGRFMDLNADSFARLPRITEVDFVG
ncbi:MAG: tRNA (adenosine(37)-N6)-threonylcarbamoyltransferase complex transferase subunit TsaD [Lentisphaeria bacterium]|nr:tRNA (adenosine(37)-N6)-threonylcarbamoyltransferase complex transferase subunit TsaD [Lentisphaeria bacterium]